MGRIPKDERGEPMYEEVDAGTAWDAILEQTEGDEGMAEMVVDSMIEDKIKELDGLRKKGIVSGGTIAEKIAAEKKLRGEIEDAQRVLGHWQEIKKQRGGKSEEKSEAAPKEVASMGEGDGVAKGEVAPKGEDAKEKAAKVVDADEGKSEDKEVDEAAKDGVAKADEEVKSGSKVDETTEEVEAKEGDMKADEDGNGVVDDEKTDEGEFVPIGKGVFGDIYDQFKGKVKEAFEFLMKHKGGDLLGVFHRDDIGDIDLVWGDYNGGLTHIIRGSAGFSVN